jgi:hypothetical protein
VFICGFVSKGKIDRSCCTSTQEYPKMSRKLVFAMIASMIVSAAHAQLKIDFSQTGGAVEAGYQGYFATRSAPATFTAQSYTAFGATVTIRPTWGANAAAAAQAMIDRGTDDGVLDFVNLLRDWIGTDTRQVGDPMTLTISGLPAGTYQWLSYHHDPHDQTGIFSVTVNDAAGSATTSGIDISNGTGTTIRRLADVTKFTTTIISNGKDDVRFVFDQTSPNSPVAGAFFVMNGFEMTKVNTALAKLPMPIDGATDVYAPVVLSWVAGDSTAATNGHKVFLSDNFADVNNGLAAAERGIVSDPVFDTAALGFTLQFSTTYYWRVDQAGTPGGPWSPGVVWRFTMEHYSVAIPGALITATADSNDVGQGPENTVNGLGLNAGGLHSVELANMWLSRAAAAGPASIQYKFDESYKLHQVWIWNHNSVLEPGIGFGVKDATIQYSTDGSNWVTLGTTHVFNPAPGAAGYAHNTTIDFDGVVAKYVKITANSNWGGKVAQYGLSEVRFFYVPVWAREPNPASGAADTEMDNVTLSWRPGREAASHNVYFSSSRQAVMNGDALVGTVSQASYDSGELQLGQTYYWKVNEVNTFETHTLWQGDVWDFSTEQYLVVDDFESYDDDYENYNRIFQVWIDGVGYSQPEPGRPGNGSGAIIGTNLAPWVEQTIVHSVGRQSMPFYYNNTVASYSEATANVADLAAGQDWTKYGIKALTLWFHGDPNNSATERMYVKLNGSKVAYDGDPVNLTQRKWHEWNIDLKDFAGVNLSNVTQLSIGFERSGGAGGSGVVYFDDIRLHPARCLADIRQPGADLNDDCVVDRLDLQIIANQWLSSGLLVTPTQPSTAGIVAHYEFEGTTNDSAGVNHGIATGDPIFAAGKVGQAIDLDGLNDYVAVEGSYLLPSYSVALWFRVDGGTGNRDLLSAYDSAGGHGILLEVTGSGALRFLHRFPFGTQGGTNIYTSTTYADGTWYHAAIVKSADTMTLYVNGQRIGSAEDNTQFSQALQRLTLGVLKHDNLTRYFPGAFDDVYLFSRALMYGEVAGLAGRTEPFSESFDLNVDGTVNFKDFAALADEWLDKQFWP